MSFGFKPTPKPEEVEETPQEEFSELPDKEFDDFDMEEMEEVDDTRIPLTEEELEKWNLEVPDYLVEQFGEIALSDTRNQQMVKAELLRRIARQKMNSKPSRTTLENVVEGMFEVDVTSPFFSNPVEKFQRIKAFELGDDVDNETKMKAFNAELKKLQEEKEAKNYDKEDTEGFTKQEVEKLKSVTSDPNSLKEYNHFLSQMAKLKKSSKTNDDPIEQIVSDEKTGGVTETQTLYSSFYAENPYDRNIAHLYKKKEPVKKEPVQELDSRAKEIVEALKIKKAYSNQQLDSNQPLKRALEEEDTHPPIEYEWLHIDSHHFVPLETNESEFMEDLEEVEKEDDFSLRDIDEEDTKNLINLLGDKRQEIVSTQARKRMRFQQWYQKSREQRKKKNETRKAKRLSIRAERKELLETYRNDPNMVYYPEVNLYISKTELKDPVIRNAISGIINNPSWEKSKKKEFIQNVSHMLNTVRNVSGDEWPIQASKILYDYGEQKKETDTRLIEHYFKLPFTDWKAMVREAEGGIEEADRLEKYAPSDADKIDNQ